MSKLKKPLLHIKIFGAEPRDLDYYAELIEEFREHSKLDFNFVVTNETVDVTEIEESAFDKAIELLKQLKEKRRKNV